MREDLKNIEEIINNLKGNDASKLKDLLKSFLKKHVKRNHVEKYMGDFPTFIEPVYLGNDVKIGDDVLLGPNVYIGNNAEIGNYVELSNTIVFDNAKIGENFKLENCIVAKNSALLFSNLREKNCILMGQIDLKENLKKISF
ncbi:MAG: hypothetical protein ACTSUT_20555 [Promethearchaeota archaeon]